jgi:hypothetical protein
VIISSLQPLCNLCCMVITVFYRPDGQVGREEQIRPQISPSTRCKYIKKNPISRFQDAAARRVVSCLGFRVLQANSCVRHDHQLFSGRPEGQV